MDRLSEQEQNMSCLEQAVVLLTYEEKRGRVNNSARLKANRGLRPNKFVADVNKLSQSGLSEEECKLSTIC